MTFLNNMSNMYSNYDIDDFDLYDTSGKYGQFGKCLRGFNITITGWCCKKCGIDRKNIKNQYYETKNIRFDKKYVFVNEKKNIPINKHWKNLNLQPPKTNQEIRKRYKQLCLMHHPDKGGSHDKFIQITKSYNKLISPV